MIQLLILMRLRLSWLLGFLKAVLYSHMAYDKKYYIRAGAHSDGATLSSGIVLCLAPGQPRLRLGC